MGSFVFRRSDVCRRMALRLGRRLRHPGSCRVRREVPRRLKPC
jgi:hypothetical protein